MSTAVDTAMPRQRPRVGRVLAWILLGLLILVTIIPIYWALRSALSTNVALTREPGAFLPVDANVGNFERVLGFSSLEEARAAGGSGQTLNILGAIWTTVIFATVITIGQVFFCAMAAYAFARLSFRGRDALFFLYLTALMIPPIFIVIPNFLLIRELGLINTIPGLVAPFFFMTPFAVFFLRQFFLGIPKEIEEAALLDGAGHTRRFFGVILPMSVAPMATLGILTYVTAWNEFLWPLVAGRDEDVRVISVALSFFKAQTPGTSAPDWTGLMAATFIAAVPILILFALVGRRVVDSIQFSGIK